MHFSTPLYFAALIVVLPGLWLANRQRKALGHSQVSLHQGLRSIPTLGRIPAICRILFMIMLIATVAQPQLIHKLVHQFFKTRDFVLTVDNSSSMNGALTDPEQQKFVVDNQAATAAPNAAPTAVTTPTAPAAATQPPKPTRSMAAREGVRQFLLHRKNDRVGLITFDDRCYFSEPIGKPEAVLKKLTAITPGSGGTNFDGPSRTASEPGAIQCTIQHFIEMKATQTRVFIMVTDGEDSIDPDRAKLLAQALHDQHIKMYVLGVGESWNGSKKQALQDFVERPEVGGQVIHVGDAKQLRDAFALIDKLEASTAESETLERAQELYPYFALATFLLLFTWVCVAAYVHEPQ